LLVANALISFDACDSFLDYVISEAIELVGPYGLEGAGLYPFATRAFDDVAVEEFSAAPETVGGADGGSQSFSNTNVQVLGVDEPDMVKTDGERIVVLSEGSLIVADVTGDEPVVVGTLQLGNFSLQNLFLSGDTVLLFGSSWTTGYPLIEDDLEFAPTFETPTVQLIEVDISDDPEVVRTMSIDGRYISARMVDDTVRLVLTSGPVGFEWSYPSGSGLRSERQAIEENQEIIRNSSAENWIPYYIVTDADGEVIDEGTLFECDRASHPEEFSGLDMLSIATIDLSDGLEFMDATGLLASGDTLYSSQSNLYVATQNWNTWMWARGGEGDSEPESVKTEIHKFDISDPTKAEYVASGAVEGYLLSQFSMDEYKGFLRVASTTSPAWWGGGTESESLVTVLEQRGEELSAAGIVDGLGKGEQIYSVRFMGPLGYVVTFRQTDPLYTIDLSDPTNPRAVGELKILGYSAYLHPVGDGLLMGIGQDANETGRVQGTQISIFDVSDPSDPRRIDQLTLDEGSSSQIEYDHHAFLYWEPTGLAMVPVQQWWWDEDSESVFFGAVGLSVEEDGDIKEVRRISHPGGNDKNNWDYRSHVLRSIVIGDSVYTISAKGIMKSDLDSLSEEAWMDF
jgi:uncharacterized secreted protein with C-terminal beta-propeller domain